MKKLSLVVGATALIGVTGYIMYRGVRAIYEESAAETAKNFDNLMSSIDKKVQEARAKAEKYAEESNTETDEFADFDTEEVTPDEVQTKETQDNKEDDFAGLSDLMEFATGDNDTKDNKDTSTDETVDY
jgi:predicted negative regulator of RcsB-dependent stress response